MEEQALRDIRVVEMDDHYVVQNKKIYLKLGLKEGRILSDLVDGHTKEIIVNKYQLSQEYIEEFIHQLTQAGLFESNDQKEPFNIFFIKIPLFNPEQMLNQLIQFINKSKFALQFFMMMCNLLVVIGICITIFCFPSIQQHMLKGFQFQDYLSLYIAIILTAFLHELGHAITCRYYGGQVDKIGFLLLFFSPALYCDISSTWMFTNKKHKLVVFFAGIYVQLLIISISALLYLGYNQNLSWLATFILCNVLMILSNIIPFIRLDGYWVLSALLNTPNLYKNSLLVVQNRVIKKQVPITKKQIIIFWYGILNITFIASSLFSGLYGLYFLSLYSKIPLSVRYVIIGLDCFIYLYFVYKILKGLFTYIINKKRGKQIEMVKR